ncbi:MAG TPA: TetR/AcrR family transcriptional regulator [Stellaceae bacterium]|nr:TetR/AcrR family transcriptional regulator [Stellaceae bacterium]
MARRQQITEIKRRIPHQARARDTVETIFEAAIRILRREGLDALNTNHIAETAGISVGTLYGYFPNKQAILVAMARRELEKTEASIRAAIARSASGTEAARAAIRALIRGFGGQNSLRRDLLQAMVVNGHYAELARPAENFARLMLKAAPGQFANMSVGLTEPQAFVLTRALVGVIRAAVFENSTWMGTDALEDELVRLAQSYVRSVASGLNSIGGQGGPRSNQAPR